jgi:sugar lactone lactonase YvrE
MGVRKRPLPAIVVTRLGCALLGALGASAALAETAAAAGPQYVVANAGNNSVSFYPLPVVTGAPTRTISGALTGLKTPVGLAFTPNSVAFVANQGANSITEYGANATGNIAPTVTISGALTGLSSPAGVAVTPAGRIYVSNAGANSITEYAVGATGNVAPAVTISGAATGLSSPRGIALDNAGNLFVANAGANSVTEYPPGATGNVSPTVTLSGAKTLLSSPFSLALSSFDDLIVGNGAANGLTAYQAGFSGNTAPLSTFKPAGLNTVGGVALADNTQILATGFASNNVLSITGSTTVGGTNSGVTSLLSGPVGIVVQEMLKVNGATAQFVQLTIGTPFAEHELAFGGVPPYTWSIASGTLPAGLTLNRATGGISGTPTGPIVNSTVTLRVTDSATTPAVSTNVRQYILNPAIQPLVYVGNGGNSAINAFALGKPGAGLPAYTTFGSGLGINAPGGLAFNSKGQLFVSNYGGGTITEYSPGPAAAPINTVPGLTTPRGIAVVPPGVWVAQQAANTLSAFTYSSITGLITGTSHVDIVGDQTGLSAPDGVAYDQGLVWVANSGNNTITAYATTATGNVTPVHTISGILTGLSEPTGLAVDAAGDLMVANEFGPTVTVYSAAQLAGLGSAPADLAPVRTITGLSGPEGIDVDSSGQIYIANSFNSTVDVFAANATGAATPVNVITGTALKAPGVLAVTPPLAILTERLPRGRLHHRYRVRLQASEGTTPYNWSLRHGPLPKGLRLSRSGVISGKPARTGRFRVTVRLRDSSRPRVSVTQRLVLVVKRR